MPADVAPVPAVWYRPMGAVRQVAELHGITTGLSDQLARAFDDRHLTRHGRAESVRRRRLPTDRNTPRGVSMSAERLERIADRYVVNGGVVESIFWAAYNEHRGAQRMAAS